MYDNLTVLLTSSNQKKEWMIFSFQGNKPNKFAKRSKPKKSGGGDEKKRLTL